MIPKAAGYFDVGELILYGKYKNKKGRIIRFGLDPKGHPIIEIEPIPKGRKQNKVMGLFKIWKAPAVAQEKTATRVARTYLARSATMQQIAIATARLDTSKRHVINADLVRAGLDGNGRFYKPGEALAKAFEVLSKHGIEMDEIVSAHRFMAPSGHTNVDLAFSNEADPFSPVSINNSTLAFQWTELQPHRFEAIAYVS